MTYRTALAACFCLLAACSGESRAPATVSSPETTPPTPNTPPPSAAPAADPATKPCAHPDAQTLSLALGIGTQTAWDLEITYAIDDDAKHGPGYMFLLRSGERRWQTHRDSNNWARSIMWRGYCWRGRGHPGVRAANVQIEIAPLCKDGKLMDMGSCGSVFKP